MDLSRANRARSYWLIRLYAWNMTGSNSRTNGPNLAVSQKPFLHNAGNYESIFDLPEDIFDLRENIFDLPENIF